MTDRLRVVLRGLAQRDAEEAIDWYRAEAGTETALRFVAPSLGPVRDDDE